MVVTGGFIELEVAERTVSRGARDKCPQGFRITWCFSRSAIEINLPSNGSGAGFRPFDRPH